MYTRYLQVLLTLRAQYVSSSDVNANSSAKQQINLTWLD